MTYFEPRPNREVFLVLELFRSRLDEHLTALAPLGEVNAPPLTDTSIYYRPDTDVALLSLRVPEPEPGDADHDGRAGWVRSFARDAGLPLLDPGRLGDGDRRRFYDAYLEAYPIRARGILGARSSALALARRLGLGEGQPVRGAAAGDAGGDLVWPAQPGLAHGNERAIPGPSPTLERRLARAGSDSGVLQLERPRGKRRAGDRLRTIPGRSRPPTPEIPPAARVRSPATSGERATILARYLRGDEWTPARLRSLSLRGAHLAVGALPRVGDIAPIALGFGDAGAVLRGRVVEVTTQVDARAQGASGFRVVFSEHEAAPLRQLTALLRKARAAGISIEPPPPRAAVRFPLRWPIQLASGRGLAVASALDISAGGLFLATKASVGAEGLEFKLPLDWGDKPVVGRARVARIVSPDMARGRGLSPGYGVEIVDLQAPDRRRYDAFLSRVSQRVERRVVVAATPERASELTAALGAVGYAVSACSDVNALERLPDATTQPADAVVVDSAFTARRALSIAELQRRLEARRAVCIAVARDAGTRVRARVDRALGIR